MDELGDSSAELGDLEVTFNNTKLNEKGSVTDSNIASESGTSSADDLSNDKSNFSSKKGYYDTGISPNLIQEEDDYFEETPFSPPDSDHQADKTASLILDPAVFESENFKVKNINDVQLRPEYLRSNIGFTRPNGKEVLNLNYEKDGINSKDSEINRVLVTSNSESILSETDKNILNGLTSIKKENNLSDNVSSCKMDVSPSELYEDSVRIVESTNEDLKILDCKLDVSNQEYNDVSIKDYPVIELSDTEMDNSVVYVGTEFNSIMGNDIQETTKVPINEIENVEKFKSSKEEEKIDNLSEIEATGTLENEKCLMKNSIDPVVLGTCSVDPNLCSSNQSEIVCIGNSQENYERVSSSLSEFLENEFDDFRESNICDLSEEEETEEVVLTASMQFDLAAKDNHSTIENIKQSASPVPNGTSIRTTQDADTSTSSKEMLDSIASKVEKMTEMGSALLSSSHCQKSRLPEKLDLPSTVERLQSLDGGDVFLVGTAHFSRESQEDVEKTIQLVRPDVVMVELCKARTTVLQLDEETLLRESKDLDFAKARMIIREHGAVQGILYLLLLNVSSHITKQLGMAPGGEFRAAFKEARRVVPWSVIQLGDRPIHITLGRALASLSVWQKAKLAWHILASKEPISKEEVEKCKNRDFIEEMLAEMTGQFPGISEVFVKERDVYLTRSLQMAVTRTDGGAPMVVVGVVGIGHVPGIMEKWGKVTDEDIAPIMIIPPPTLSSRILKATFKFGIYGTTAFVAYKLIPQSAKSFISRSVVSSLQNLKELYMK